MVRSPLQLRTSLKAFLVGFLMTFISLDEVKYAL